MPKLLLLFFYLNLLRLLIKIFATCCVIVEAPSNLLDATTLDILFTTALITPLASTPG